MWTIWRGKNDLMELSWPLARSAFFTSLAIPAHPLLPVQLWAMPLFTSCESKTLTAVFTLIHQTHAPTQDKAEYITLTHGKLTHNWEFVFKGCEWVGVKAPEWSSLAALEEHPGSVPSTHTATHNHHRGPRGYDTLFCLCGHACVELTYVQAENIHTYKYVFKTFFKKEYD